jgi:hypothetical protein
MTAGEREKLRALVEQLELQLQRNRPAMDLAGGVPGAVVMAESSQRETADA